MSAVSNIDWTDVWVNTSSLSPGEVILSFFLLSLTIIIEILSYLLHNFKDSVTEINTNLVRNPEIHFQRTSQYGFNYQSHFVTLHLTTKPGRPQIHYLDEGPQDATNVLVLLHGEPFWSFAWTKVIPGLSRNARVIVPDLVGFGKSDKYVDWRMYDLNLHIETVIMLLDYLGVDGDKKTVTLVGHNWGWMIGAGVARVKPDLFSNLVILNTNNLPDGEVNLSRYSDLTTLTKFLVLNSFFLFFRSSMNLLREYFPLGILVHSLNQRYSSDMVKAMTSPWPSKEYCGGTTAFPLMVPVSSNHPEAPQMKLIRDFLSTWTKPTLILYSEPALFPWLQYGDFVVGRRSDFYNKMIPGVARYKRLPGQVGHLVMWDAPYMVVDEIRNFLQY